MTSLFWVIASLFLAQNSLFDCLGKFGQRGRNTETTKQCRSCDGSSFANFPVFFPVCREFGTETSSPWTASSASQSSLSRPFPFCRKSYDISGTWSQFTESPRRKGAELLPVPSNLDPKSPLENFPYPSVES